MAMNDYSKEKNFLELELKLFRTSDKRAEKENERETIYEIRRKNLFIIRELVQFICIKEKTSINDFYFYLFNDLIEDKKNILKKSADRYAHLMFDTGKNNINKITSNFINCGISPEYFDNQEIKFTDDSPYGLKAHIDEYLSLVRNSLNDKANDDLDDDLKGALICLRESISEHYLEIVNLDGTPMIDNIRLLVNNMIQHRRNEYAVLGEKPKLDSACLYAIAISLPYNIHKIAESLLSDTLNKNIYTNKKSSENIKINYLLIRTIFEILCEIDEIISPDAFYELLEMSKKEYDNIIDTGIAENKLMFSKLGKYAFSHTIFRGDNPSLIKMHSTIKDTTKKY